MMLFDGVHLTSTSSEAELAAVARLLRLDSRWLQVSNTGVVHYDLWGAPARRAAKLIGTTCSPRTVARRGVRRRDRKGNNTSCQPALSGAQLPVPLPSPSRN